MWLVQNATSGPAVAAGPSFPSKRTTLKSAALLRGMGEHSTNRRRARGRPQRAEGREGKARAFSATNWPEPFAGPVDNRLGKHARQRGRDGVEAQKAGAGIAAKRVQTLKSGPWTGMRDVARSPPGPRQLAVWNLNAPV